VDHEKQSTHSVLIDPPAKSSGASQHSQAVANRAIAAARYLVVVARDRLPSGSALLYAGRLIPESALPTATAALARDVVEKADRRRPVDRWRFADPGR
jgi:hypothetical protein